MTGSRILLDTNIISAWLKGETAIADKINQSLEVYIPIQVLGELYFGAQYSTQLELNLRNIQKLANNYTVLNTDRETASIYGIIKASLKKKGRPIPENDIWIATIAQQYQLILITRDKHFNEINSLEIENW